MTLIPPVNPSAVQAPAGKQQFFRTKLPPPLHIVTTKKLSSIVTSSRMDEVVHKEFAATFLTLESRFDLGMWPQLQHDAKSDRH